MDEETLIITEDGEIFPLDDGKCKYILTRGANKGRQCSKNGIYDGYCTAHKKTEQAKTAAPVERPEVPQLKPLVPKAAPKPAPKPAPKKAAPVLPPVQEEEYEDDDYYDEEYYDDEPSEDPSNTVGDLLDTVPKQDTIAQVKQEAKDKKLKELEKTVKTEKKKKQLKKDVEKYDIPIDVDAVLGDIEELDDDVQEALEPKPEPPSREEINRRKNLLTFQAMGGSVVYLIEKVHNHSLHKITNQDLTGLHEASKTDPDFQEALNDVVEEYCGELIDTMTPIGRLAMRFSNLALQVSIQNDTKNAKLPPNIRDKYADLND